MEKHLPPSRPWKQMASQRPPFPLLDDGCSHRVYSSVNAGTMPFVVIMVV